jgi:hypothetical protein
MHSYIYMNDFSFRGNSSTQIMSSFSTRIFTNVMLASVSPTIITEDSTTAAAHRIATHCPLDPKLAFRALLELGSNHKLVEFFIILSIAVRNSILCATHPIMILAPTIETVMLSADRTTVIIENSIMTENCCTPGCWAP